MNRVIFKELLIADIEAKTAKTIKFGENKNLLTSANNHLGKSLICKALYYTLGAETFFSDAWKRVNAIYQLSFLVQNKLYKVVRKDNIFTVYEPDGKIVKLFKTKNFSQYINNLFQLDIKLVAKDENKSIISSSPVFMYLPYYIDQEYGWTPETESFDRLQQFNKPQRTISLFYHLGCYGNDYVETDLLHKKLTDEQSAEEALLIDYKRIIDYLQELLDKNGEFLTTESELNDKIQKNKSTLNSLLDKMEKLKNEIIKLENEKAIAIRSKANMEAFLKKETKSKPEIQNVQCPKCGYEFSHNFNERFERQYLLESINAELGEISVTINKLSEKIETKNREYVELRNSFALIEKTISLDENLYDNYIKMKSAKSLIKENQEKIGSLAISIARRAETIRALAKKLREYRKRVEEAESIYKFYLASLFKELNISSEEVNPRDHAIGDTIRASGAYKDRVILAKYYAFLLTKNRLASNITNFPIIVDSPRGDEQDKENAKIIMDFILRESTLSNQLIVATIDGSDYLEDKIDVNVIELTNERHSLLDANDYNENEKEIVTMLLNLSE